MNVHNIATLQEYNTIQTMINKCFLFQSEIKIEKENILLKHFIVENN